MSNKTKGILCIILAAFSFSWMFCFVRLAGDVPSVQKTLFRNIFTLFVSAAMLIKSGRGFKWKKEATSGLVLRSAFGLFGVLCNFYAIDRLMTADASILNKLSPFFAIIFSFVILKERVKLYQAIGVITAFIGALFVIKPGGNSFDPAMIFGAIGGMCAGIAYTYVRKVTQAGEKGTIVVFFFSAFSTLLLLPYVLFNFYPMTVYQWLMLIGAGLGATGGQFGITAAYAFTPAREVSVYDYMQIVFSAGLGFILFGDIPDVLSVIGYVIIITTSVVMFIINNRKENQVTQ